MSSGTIQLKDDLLNLKGRLETIESQLSGQTKEIELREQKWVSMNEKADKIFTSQRDIVRFNVGGKKFATTRQTVMANRETLFCKLLESEKINSQEEIFFDRSPKMFPFILDYLRNGQISYKKFIKQDLEILRDDAEYYRLSEILEYLDSRLGDIEFVCFDFSGAYVHNNQTAAVDRVKDLKDKSCMKGICTKSPGWIHIELNGEWEFDSLEIGGWLGNAQLWYPDNGAGASILTSVDNETWITVGSIPYGYGNSIATVKLIKSSARFIKFSSNSYLGIGYLFIKKFNQ
jgi:hypothetical protein